MMPTTQLAKTLIAIIRDHVQKHGLVVERDDLLVVFDSLTGRFVITFEVFEAASEVASE